MCWFLSIIECVDNFFHYPVRLHDAFLDTNNISSTGSKIIPYVFYACAYIVCFALLFFVSWMLHGPITRVETINIKYHMAR